MSVTPSVISRKMLPNCFVAETGWRYTCCVKDCCPFREKRVVISSEICEVRE